MFFKWNFRISILDNEGHSRVQYCFKRAYLLKTPPKSEAFKHSGGESLLCTSATVTLYFEVELSNESRPGTEQNTSEGTIPSIMFS